MYQILRTKVKHTRETLTNIHTDYDNCIGHFKQHTHNSSTYR